ncbi:cytochrome P450 [Thozetella sp. PMI_491]|nr:cytochrome P450 [Thozetella sp. PMI_491]
MTILPSSTLAIELCLLFTTWVVYRICFSPLRRIPGPFLAKRTHLWKAYHMFRGDLPEAVLKAHEVYGPTIRIGPNDVNFQGREAIEPIYKAGRTMPKAAFYEGFGVTVPNMFNSRDEEASTFFHAVRRRQMSHSFSQAGILKFEPIFDKHLSRLLQNIEQSVGRIFDIKELVACYAYDVIGELAFDQDFNTQDNPTVKNLPPIPDHILLSSLFGLVPSLLPYSITLSKYLPIPQLQRLLASRKLLYAQTVSYVQHAIETHVDGDRGTLLASILEAKDPDTGSKLTRDEVCSEAFVLLIAGAHTTAATLGFLFYHLTHNPSAGKTLTDELLENLPLYQQAGDEPAYAGLESKLSYTMACIKENFRMTAVLNFPLPRLVTAKGGVEICGYYVPSGTTVSMINHVLHHDPDLWGSDHNKYSPERWIDGGAFQHDIMPFGAGHRACLGRHIANVNILKVLSTLWRNFEFEPVDPQEKLQMESLGVGEKKGPLLCRVRRREA